jgi:hypothetical protein
MNRVYRIIVFGDSFLRHQPTWIWPTESRTFKNGLTNGKLRRIEIKTRCSRENRDPKVNYRLSSRETKLKTIIYRGKTLREANPTIKKQPSLYVFCHQQTKVGGFNVLTMTSQLAVARALSEPETTHLEYVTRHPPNHHRE